MFLDSKTANSHGSRRRNANPPFTLTFTLLRPMTLGRSSTGAIKIKTDEAGGGLRAVNCGCCGGGGCDCYTARPINPPSDPDFTKRLRGDDPSVPAYGSVTIDCTVTSSTWGTPSTFGANVSGNWVDGGDCTFLGEPVVKILQTTECWYGDCGGYGGCGLENFIGLALLLTASGCLYFTAYDEMVFGGFRILTPSGECQSDSSSSVQINGVIYSAISLPTMDGDSASGSATITFS